MPLDYSKFDKIEDSDEEENYDDYLRERYGITSDWRPGCGMQPPVLGGRTPGKIYEEHELDPVNFEFPEDDNRPEGEADDEHAAQAPTQAAAVDQGRWPQYLLGTLRAIESVAWLLPTFAFVYAVFVLNAEVKIEMAVYPVTCTLTLIMGFFDAVVAAMGATHAEGRGAVAFACWFKRSFLAMSFLAYEAQFTSDGARLLGLVPMRLLSGLLMICLWTLRKLYSYVQDMRNVMRGGDSSSSSWLPWGRRFLIAEALAEALFALVHIALLPAGVRFLGLGDSSAMCICTGACLLLCNAVALICSRQALGKASKSD